MGQGDGGAKIDGAEDKNNAQTIQERKNHGGKGRVKPAAKG